MRIGIRTIPKVAALSLVLVPILLSECGRAQEPGKAPRPVPRFEGTTIPDPPQQGRPWTL